MKQYFIGTANFFDLIAKLRANSKVIAPVKFNEISRLVEINDKNISDIDIFGYRTVESYKSYLFKLIERVSRYFGHDEAPQGKNLTFLGVRACDLEALEVVDRVFGEGDFKDPFYLVDRKNILLIATDCTASGETCFCTMVGGKPYPTRYFDINLTPVIGGFAAEVGSDKGNALITENPGLFMDADTSMLKNKDKIRQMVTALLDENNRNYRLKFKISDSHKVNLTNKIWKTLTKDCVECSSCNFICPTCTCFLLVDEAGAPQNERFKEWDACLKGAYAKVAGGANPRGKLYERLQNRYHCKFDYSFDRLGRYTCVGCGRCIDGCAGNIDMRKIFVELEKQAPLTAKLE